MTTLKAATAALAEATAAVMQEIRAGRDAIERAREELREFELARLPLAEARANAELVVRRTGEAWLEARGSALLTSPGEYTGTLFGRSLATPSDGGKLGIPHGAMHDAWGWTCAAEPERAVGILVALLERLEASGRYVQGPPLAERQARAEKLRADLARLEAADERRTETAIAAGVRVEHRPEVIEARKEEERRRGAAAADREAIRRREAALNQDHEQRRTRRVVIGEASDRAARSTYIESGRRGAYSGQ